MENTKKNLNPYSVAKIAAAAALIPTAYVVSQNVVKAEGEGDEGNTSEINSSSENMTINFIEPVHFANGLATDDAETRKTDITITGTYVKDNVSNLFIYLNEDTNGLDIISGTSDAPAKTADESISGYVNEADGTWSITFSKQALELGEYTIGARINSETTNDVESSVLIVNSTPTLFTDSPNYTISANNLPGTVAISGSFEDADNDVIKSVEVHFDGEADVISATIDNDNKTWSASIPTTGLTRGKYVLKVVANDYIENSEETSVELKVGDAPVCTINNDHTDPIDFTNESKIITFSGTATSPCNVPFKLFVKFDNNEYEEVEVNADGTWAKDFDIKGLSDGRHYISVYGQDTDELTTSAETSSYIYINQQVQADVSIDNPNPDAQQYTNESNIVKIYGSFNSESSSAPVVTATIDGDDIPAENIIVNENIFEISVDTKNLSINPVYNKHKVTVTVVINGIPAEGYAYIDIINSAPSVTATPVLSHATVGNSMDFQIDVSDKNSGQEIEIFYSTDNGQNYTSLGTSTCTNKRVSKTVTIPASEFTSAGTKSIKFKVSDGIEEATTTNESYNVIDVTPTVTIVTPSDQLFTNIDNVITIRGTIATESDVAPTVTAVFNNEDVSASDITVNGNAFEISVNTKNLAISDTGYDLSVTANVEGKTDTETTSIKVVNAAPTITVTPASNIVNIGKTLNCTVEIEDSNPGQTLTYSYSKDGGVTFEDLGNTVNNGTKFSKTIVLPADDFATKGEKSFVFKVTDGTATVNSDAINITVKDPTPVIAMAAVGVPDQQFTVSDNMITFTGTITTESSVTPVVSATFNGNAVPADNITLEGNNLSITVNTASLPVSDSGYTLSVSATAEGETGTGSATVKVINSEPQISASTEKTVINIGDTLPVSIIMTDINAGQTLEYSYSTDGGATYKTIGTAETGGIALTRTFDVPASVFSSEGDVTIKFKVSDTFTSANTTKDVTVRVIDPTPVVTMNTTGVAPQQFTKNENKVTFTGTITTKSASTPTVTAVFNGKDVPASDITLEGTALSITVDTANLAVNNGYALSVTSVVDGKSSTGSASVDVVNTTPTISARVNMTSLLINTPLSVSLNLKDINPGQTLTYSYSTDNGQTFTDFGTVESTGNAISKSVTIPASVFNTAGDQPLVFKVSDGITSNEATIKIKVLAPEDPTPIVAFDQDKSNNDDQQYTTEENIIKFYGTVSTKSSSVPTLSATFNGKAVDKSNIKFDGKNFVISINTASLPVKDGYELIVKANVEGTTGSGQSEVDIVNTPSVITASANVDTIGVGEGIDINLNITDQNPGQKVTYSYSTDGGKNYSDFGSVNIATAGEENTVVGRINSVSNTEGPVFIKIRAFDGVDFSYADKDISVNIADTTPVVKIDESESFTQQFTTNSNVVVYTGSFDTLSSVTPVVSATFNGEAVPASNITLEGKNFTVSVDVSNFPVSNTPYALNVNVAVGEKTGTATAPIKITNTPASIVAMTETSTVKVGSSVPVKLTFDDKNPGQTLEYSYSTDGGKTFTSLGTTTYNGETVSEMVEIPGSVFANEGQVRLTFKVNDGVEDTITTEETDVLIDVIPASDITPIIQIDSSTTTDQQVTANDNIITIRGKVTTTATEIPTVSALFNGMEVAPENVVLNGEDLTITINTKGLAVNLDGYSLEVSASVGAKTGFGKSLIRVVNTPPTLNINKYTGKGSVTVSGSASDINPGQKVIIQYSIDDSVWKDLASFEVGQDGTFSEALDEIITANNKKISFRAFDGVDYSAVIDKIVDSTIIADENAIVKINVSDAPAKITVGDSAKVTLNVEASDIGAVVNVYRTIDGGEKVLVKTYTTDGTPFEVKDTIEGLEKGSYTIKYTAESGSISNGDTIMLTVADTSNPNNPDNPNNPNNPDNPDNPNNPDNPVKPDKPSTPTETGAPELYIDEIDTDVRAGADIPFVLKVKDADVGQKVTVYYKVDKEKPVKIESFKSKGKTYTVEGTLPADLAMGDHTIIFYAEDEDGLCSNDDGDEKVKDVDKDKGNKIEITVSNSVPVVKIISCSTNINVNDSVPVSLSVSDVDIDQDITVYYRVDDAFPVKVASFKSDGTAKTVNFAIPALTTGDHTIIFYAEDSEGERSNKDGDVSIENSYGSDKNINKMSITVIGEDTPKRSSKPSVDIITNVANIKKNEPVKITFSVLDKDKGEKVTIYYSVDGGEAKEFLTYTSNGVANVQTVDLGKLDSSKNHKVAIWAVDASGNRSDSDMSIAAIKDEDKPSGGQTTIPGTSNKPGPIKTGVESSAAPRSILSAIVGLGAVSAAGISLFKKKKK